MADANEARRKLSEWKETLRKAESEIKWWEDELRIREDEEKKNKQKNSN